MVKIILEPDLEVQAGHLNAEECRRLARLYYRWSKQLFVKARILDSHGNWVTVRIVLEPELQIQSITLDASQCRSLARLYRRWSRQLYSKANALDVHAGLWPQRQARRRALYPQRLNRRPGLFHL